MLRPLLRKTIIIAVLGSLLASSVAYAQGTPPRDPMAEPLRIFNVDPGIPDNRLQRTLTNCLGNLMRFYYIAGRFSDIPSHIRLRWPPFFRDLFLRPAQFADVMNIEQQLNRTRITVMSTALRCNVQQFQAAERAYYKLEAELYYVRYFVDATPIPTIHPGWSIMNALGAAGAQIKIPRVTDDPARREKFLNEMIDAFGAIPGLTEIERRSLIAGYFEEFDAKYKDRVNAYASGDASWDELAAKIDRLVDTIKSLKNLGDEIKSLVQETGRAAAALGRAVGDKAKSLAKSPGKVLGEAVKSVHDMFQVCPKADIQECKPYYEVFKDVVGAVTGAVSSVQDFSEKKTFEDVRVAIQSEQGKQREDFDEGAMRARYEALYGQVAGDGISEIVDKMDDLIKILTVGRGTEILGSFRPLEQVKQCVRMARTRECS